MQKPCLTGHYMLLASISHTLMTFMYVGNLQDLLRLVDQLPLPLPLRPDGVVPLGRARRRDQLRSWQVAEEPPGAHRRRRR